MPPALRNLARSQAGAFTRTQARAAGVSEREVQRLLLTGEWVALSPAVMVCAGTPVTEQLTAWAATLHVGPPVALAGPTAGRLLDLERVLPARRPRVVVPGNRHPERAPWMEVRRVTPARWVARQVHGLPVTPVHITIRDLAAELDRDDLRDVVQHALRRRQVTLAALDAACGRGLAGSRRLRAVLDELRPGYQVHWERVLHRALSRAGLRMTPQVLVEAPGGRRAYIDLGIERLRFGVEIDGFVNHMARFAADRRRARMLAVEMGWTIVSYTVSEVAVRLDSVVTEIVDYAGRLAAAVRAGGGRARSS